MTLRKNFHFKPIQKKLRERISFRHRICDYCGDKEWNLPKLPNGLRRCTICTLPPDARAMARSKLAVKEGEGLIEAPSSLIIPVDTEELIVKPN